mgnify:FL=1
MKVILIMVSSLNGKITRGDDSDPTHWASKEDTALFASMKAQHNLIVMGSRTYEASQNKIKLKDSVLRIVLTNNPKRYESYTAPGQLEFTNEHPKHLVKRLEAQRFKKLLLVGGGETNTAFFKERLVDEIHLTLEPVLFGNGKPLISEGQFETKLRLTRSEKLNGKGTLHLVYNVIR